MQPKDINLVYTREFNHEEISDVIENLTESSYMRDLPQDQYGFVKGKFTLTITWEQPDETI